MVRAGIYEGLSTGTRARGHRSAARLLGDAGRERASRRALLASEPAADARASTAWSRPLRCRTQAWALLETASVYLRRALAEPPKPNERLHLARARDGGGQRRPSRVPTSRPPSRPPLTKGRESTRRWSSGSRSTARKSGAAAIEVLDSHGVIARSCRPGAPCSSRRRRPGSRSRMPSRRRVSTAGGGRCAAGGC